MISYNTDMRLLLYRITICIIMYVPVSPQHNAVYSDKKLCESKHAESRARYERDTSHVICLPHIRQNLTALITRLCEKLQSHLRGCFGVGHPKRLGSKRTMKEACRVPASIASWPLRAIYPSRRHRPK